MHDGKARHIYVYAEEGDAGGAYYKVGKATEGGRWDVRRLENVAHRQGCAQSCTAVPIIPLAVIEYPDKPLTEEAERAFAAEHRPSFGVRVYPQHEWYRGSRHETRGLAWQDARTWFLQRGGIDRSALYLHIHGKYQRGAWEQDLGIGGRAMPAPLRIHLIIYTDGETNYLRMCASKYPWKKPDGKRKHGRVHRDYNTGNWRPVRYLLRAEPNEDESVTFGNVNEGALGIMRQAWTDFGRRQVKTSMMLAQPSHSLAWFRGDEAEVVGWLQDRLNRAWPHGWADTSDQV